MGPCWRRSSAARASGCWCWRRGAIRASRSARRCCRRARCWMWILAQRFDVPEIQHLTRPDSILRARRPTCGIKRALGFLYHEEGKRQDPAKSNLLIAPSTPLDQREPPLPPGHRPLHAERGDQLRRRLPRPHRRRRLRDRRRRRRLRTGTGEEFAARFLVDGAGFRSPLADRFGLRETPTPLETQSRSIFTHMTGSSATTTCLRAGGVPGLSAGWSEGTLHHVFEGGWFWIIPLRQRRGLREPRCAASA